MHGRETRRELSFCIKQSNHIERSKGVGEGREGGEGGRRP